MAFSSWNPVVPLIKYTLECTLSHYFPTVPISAKEVVSFKRSRQWVQNVSICESSSATIQNLGSATLNRGGVSLGVKHLVGSCIMWGDVMM